MVQLYSILKQRNNVSFIHLYKKPTIRWLVFLLPGKSFLDLFLHNDRKQNVQGIIPAVLVHQLHNSLLQLDTLGENDNHVED